MINDDGIPLRSFLRVVSYFNDYCITYFAAESSTMPTSALVKLVSSVETAVTIIHKSTRLIIKLIIILMHSYEFRVTPGEGDRCNCRWCSVHTLDRTVTYKSYNTHITIYNNKYTRLIGYIIISYGFRL